MKEIGANARIDFGHFHVRFNGITIYYANFGCWAYFYCWDSIHGFRFSFERMEKQ